MRTRVAVAALYLAVIVGAGFLVIDRIEHSDQGGGGALLAMVLGGSMACGALVGRWLLLALPIVAGAVLLAVANAELVEHDFADALLNLGLLSVAECAGLGVGVALRRIAVGRAR